MKDRRVVPFPRQRSIAELVVRARACYLAAAVRSGVDAPFDVFQLRRRHLLLAGKKHTTRIVSRRTPYRPPQHSTRKVQNG